MGVWGGWGKEDAPCCSSRVMDPSCLLTTDEGESGTQMRPTKHPTQVVLRGARRLKKNLLLKIFKISIRGKFWRGEGRIKRDEQPSLQQIQPCNTQQALVLITKTCLPLLAFRLNDKNTSCVSISPFAFAFSSTAEQKVGGKAKIWWRKSLPKSFYAHSRWVLTCAKRTN